MKIVGIERLSAYSVPARRPRFWIQVESDTSPEIRDRLGAGAGRRDARYWDYHLVLTEKYRDGDMISIWLRIEPVKFEWEITRYSMAVSNRTLIGTSDTDCIRTLDSTVQWITTLSENLYSDIP